MYETTPVAFRVPTRVRRWSFSRYTGALLSFTVSDVGGVQKRTNYRAGSDLLGWRKIIHDGGNATTYFEGAKYDGEWLPGQVTTGRWVSGAERQETITTGGFYSPMPDLPSGSSLPADNLALKRLYKQLGNRRTRFQGGVALGELRETIRMIKHPAAALTKAFTGYYGTIQTRLKSIARDNSLKGKKNALRTAKKVKSMVAETWLEKSFGWDPFINDISAGLKAYRKLSEADTREVISSHGMTEEATYIYINDPFNWDGGDQTCKRDFIQLDRYEVRYKVGVKLQTAALTPQRVFEQFGFVKAQLVPTLWELTPWSFLVDYFTNIGDVLEASAVNTSDVTWVCKNIRKTRFWLNYTRLDPKAFFAVYPAKYYGSYISGVPGSCVTSAIYVQRSPILEVPFPQLRWEIPGSPRQWLNMGALALARKGVVSQFNSMGNRFRP